MLKRISLVLIIAMLFALIGSTAAMADTSYPKLILTQTDIGDGKIQVDVWAKQFTNVYGAQMVLNFDKSKLEALELNSGELIKGNSVVEVSKKIDNANGKIVYAVTNTGEASATAERGVLATIIFKKSGNIDLGRDIRIDTKTIFADTQGNIIAANLQGKFGIMTIEKVNTADNFKLGGEAKVSVKVTNDTPGTQDVTFIMGLYDKETNKLIDLTYVKQSEIVKDQTIEMTTSLKIPETGSYKVKCFVWSDIDKMEALSDMVEIGVN